MGQGILLFLDFDGVLRRRSAPLYRLERELVSRLEAVLREHASVHVVITSSWKEAFTLAELRVPFSPDISSRILGTTPNALHRTGPHRQREILAYLKSHAPAPRWVALDDDREHYQPGAPVVFTDPERGFDDSAAATLRAFLEAES